MKKIYTAQDPAEANIVRGMLGSHGIRVEVRGEMLWAARGLIPMTSDTAPTVWVQEEDVERAVALISRGSEGVGSAVWTCAKCGEEVEPELGECWSCGTERPEATE